MNRFIRQKGVHEFFKKAMIIDKDTKTTWTIFAIILFVISGMDFKNYQSSASSKGLIYARQ